MNLHVPIAAAVGHRLDEANLRLRVGEHIVDFGSLKIVTRPESSRLTGKSAAVLMELARHAGNTVTRDELLDRIWKGRCPTPDVLTQAITELRCALADDSKSPHYIETTPKVGYRLIAPVLVLDGPVGSVFSDAVEPAHEPASAALVSHSADAVLASSARSRFPVFALICLFGIAAASIALAFVNHRQLPAKRSCAGKAQILPRHCGAKRNWTCAHCSRSHDGQRLAGTPGGLHILLASLACVC